MRRAIERAELTQTTSELMAPAGVDAEEGRSESELRWVKWRLKEEAPPKQGSLLATTAYCGVTLSSRF